MAANTGNDDRAIVNAFYNRQEKVTKFKLNNNRQKKKGAREMLNFVNVQLCEVNVSTKFAKYGRVGGLKYVDVSTPIDDVDLALLTFKVVNAPSLGNVKVDLLATERGPIVEKIIQLGILKDGMVINARRVITASAPVYQQLPRIIPAPFESQGPVKKSFASPFLKKRSSTYPPGSLTPSKLVKLGKTIKDVSVRVPVSLMRFSYRTQQWLPQRFCSLVIVSELAKGGFRSAKDCLVDGEKKVMKEYLDGSKELIDDAGLTLEMHAKKSVQMHMCASYYASKLAEQLKTAGHTEECFRYVDCEFGNIIGGERNGLFITIEPKLDGPFVKYINNNGDIEFDSDNNLREMAETLSHFSYEHSAGRMILFDIQGVGLNLTDPAVATVEEDYDGEHPFCVDNMGLKGMKTFFLAHQCNVYCKNIGLSNVDVGKFDE